jgi:hypothetical protein
MFGCGLLGLMSSLQTFAFGPAPYPVGLSFLDARRMARNADAHGQAQVEALLVRQTELTCQLVDPHLLGQVVP